MAEPNGQIISEETKTAKIRISLVPRDGTPQQSRQTIITELVRQRGQDVVKRQWPTPHNMSPMTLKSSQKLFVCGYGAGRGIEGPDAGRAYRIVDSTYTLFNYDQTLIDPELMIRRLRDFLNTTTYRNTIRGIKNVLGLSQSDTITLDKGGGVFVKGPSIGKRIPLEGWADGYRKTFNWILDLYGWAIRAGEITASGGVSGILLIDELEQHLHPSMQTGLLGLLGKFLPKLQVFVTTHSPLVTLGASPNDLVVLQRRGKHVFARDKVPDFKGYSVEDVLRDDDLFDTKVYSPELNTKLAEYRQLAITPRSKLGTAKKLRLKRLAQELKAQQLIDVEESSLMKELMRFRKELEL